MKLNKKVDVFSKKSIKMSDYFEIVNPDYLYFQITPTTNTRNHSTDKFEEMISRLYNDCAKALQFQNKKLIVTTKAKLSYYVYMEKGGQVSFYFIVPSYFKNQFKDKVSNNWCGVAVKEIPEQLVPRLSDDCSKYALMYSREDGLSLEANKTNNHLIDSTINVLDILEDGDRVAILYNFVPIDWYGQRTFSAKYKETMGKLEQFKPVDKNKGDLKYILKTVATIIFNIIDGVVNFHDNKKGKKDDLSPTELAMLRVMGKTYAKTSNATDNKKGARVVETQIIIMSESKDKNREKINAKAVSTSFNVISGDNSLVPKKIKGKLRLDSKYVADKKYGNTMSDLELSNLIALPSKDKLREKNIECIQITEKAVPEELRTGDLCLGNAPIKGMEMKAHISDDVQIGNLPIVMIAPQNAGKSTMTENLVVNANKAKKKEANVIFDFIKECELSKNIERNIDKEDCVVIDLSKEEGLQGFGFNEVKYYSIKDGITRLEGLELMKIANKQTQQIIALVDAINNIGDPLSPKMRRYLNAACFLAFLHPNQSLLDVINILEDFTTRDEYLNKIPESVKGMMKSKVNILRELDERNKQGFVCGTNFNKIEFILDRVDLLREDVMLEIMFNKPITDNIDFMQLIEEGKTIMIRMPESEYSTEYVKNVLVTFFMSKVWLAAQLRKANTNSTRVNVIVDEIYQAPTCMKMLKRILPQCRKFRVRMILSVHFANQVKEIWEVLKGAGASFMLLQGCDKKNFKELNEEFDNLGYEVDTLLNLKKHQSLNLIKVKNGYAAFVTQMPLPLPNRVEENANSYDKEYDYE